jgi:hypothetical protein
LHTIADYDKVLVMDNGLVIEYASPIDLLVMDTEYSVEIDLDYFCRDGFADRTSQR